MKDRMRTSAPGLALWALALVIGPADAVAQIRKATVEAQSLPVYLEMSADSEKIGTLQHATAVHVLLSVTTGDGSWCGIANADSTVRLGYVECSGLTIEAASMGAGTSTSGVASQNQPRTHEQEAWALAASAIAATANHEGTSALAADTPARARAILVTGWNVHTRDDLFNALSELENGEESATFSKIGERVSHLSDPEFDKAVSRLNPLQANAFRVAREYYPSVQGRSLLGWEYARYINVCRWGVAAGYMTEAEAWPRVMNIARNLQSTFGSWQEFAQNYMVGRKFVHPIDVGTPYESLQTAYNWLIGNPASPWQRIPWNQPLN